jgi:hypothetical protein
MVEDRKVYLGTLEKEGLSLPAQWFNARYEGGLT